MSGHMSTQPTHLCTCENEAGTQTEPAGRVRFQSPLPDTQTRPCSNIRPESPHQNDTCNCEHQPHGDEDEHSDPKTSDYYHTFGIPWKFEHPGKWNYGNPVFTCTNESARQYTKGEDLQGPASWMRGWPHRRHHPLFKTTYMDYGAQPPSVHTVPVTYFPSSMQFSEHLLACGMYRNRSLNTAIDRSKV